LIKVKAKFEPMNPAPPVSRIVSFIECIRTEYTAQNTRDAMQDPPATPRSGHLIPSFFGRPSSAANHANSARSALSFPRPLFPRPHPESGFALTVVFRYIKSSAGTDAAGLLTQTTRSKQLNDFPAEIAEWICTP
jgi:hypothetical protein